MAHVTCKQPKVFEVINTDPYLTANYIDANIQSNKITLYRIIKVFAGDTQLFFLFAYLIKAFEPEERSCLDRRTFHSLAKKRHYTRYDAID